MTPNTAAGYTVSAWYSSKSKRVCDFCGAAVLLLLFLPLMGLAAVAVKLTSPGPILFRQKRPGKNGKEFSILKFRTMRAEPYPSGPVLTRAEDPRVTRIGKYMRKWKIDELPQLFNVLSGQMSFVGPRPQPTKLWKQPAIQNEAACILSVRPGITSQATLSFRNEEELLAPLSPEEIEQVYMTHVMPLKLRIDLDYLHKSTFRTDMGIVVKTFFRIFNRKPAANDELVKQCLPIALRQKRGLVPEVRQE